MDRLENVVSPVPAGTVMVPESVPPPGLAPMATVMLAVELVTVLPNASCTATCTAGLITAPAAAFAGCTAKASFDEIGRATWRAGEVAPVSAAAAAVSV